MGGRNYYKLNSILRRQYDFILTASWEKIYSVLGGIAREHFVGESKRHFVGESKRIKYKSCAD